MKKIAATLSLSLVLACAGAPALAQAPAPAPAVPTAAATAAATAAVGELLEVMNFRAMMVDAFRQMSAQMPQMMRSGAEASLNAARLGEAERAAKLAEVDARLARAVPAIDALYNDPTLVDEMIAEIVPLYARYFTADEMHQMAAFYRTPVGRKALQQMPQLMGESMQIGQKVVTPRIEKLMRSAGFGAD